MAPKAKAKAQRGRPPEAKTVSRPLVEMELSVQACPHCSRSNVQPTNKRNRRDVTGAGSFGGRQYDAVTFWTANCGNCGGALSVIQRHFTD